MPRPAVCRAYQYYSIGLRRFSCSSPPRESLHAIQSILGGLENVDIDDFCKRAFVPEKPFLIKNTRASRSSIPAAARWFTSEDAETLSEPVTRRRRVFPSYEYLHTFQDTILPYELTNDSADPSSQSNRNPGAETDLDTLIRNFVGTPSAGSFHRFSAPLALFLKASAASLANSSPSPQLYIAQAQITDLPRQLQEDLPTPTLVKTAGKGDIYDANIWIGLPPTYTPLHRDPNPNLFVQLASSKIVRLYEPSVGAGIIRDVRRSIGQSAQINLRGEEMMAGPERDALHEAIWGRSAPAEGFEVVVNPGDALFIPKGWWHSIKSIGTDVTASVNWWFR